MYAIVFDFDTQVLEQTYPNASWRNAYTDVRGFLTQRGFEWKQGSAYFGDDTVDAVRCVRVVPPSETFECYASRRITT